MVFEWLARLGTFHHKLAQVKGQLLRPQACFGRKRDVCQLNFLFIVKSESHNSLLFHDSPSNRPVVAECSETWLLKPRNKLTSLVGVVVSVPDLIAPLSPDDGFASGQHLRKHGVLIDYGNARYCLGLVHFDFPLFYAQTLVDAPNPPTTRLRRAPSNDQQVGRNLAPRENELTSFESDLPPFFPIPFASIRCF
uniref:Uncharacterized protein n=1 Tax=Mesocestoides corti TaxID=53468 RepID=A0A5K3G7J4_MESCO